jgi:hypothetical protein
MALVSYSIALMIGLVGVSYLIAVVVIKTALFWMDKGNNE